MKFLDFEEILFLFSERGLNSEREKQFASGEVRRLSHGGDCGARVRRARKSNLRSKFIQALLLFRGAKFEFVMQKGKEKHCGRLRRFGASVEEAALANCTVVQTLQIKIVNRRRKVKKIN